MVGAMVDKRRVRAAPAMDVHFPFDFDKALEALVYLASRKIEAFDKYKASKLLFLADKYHLVKYSRPITGDQYFAMYHGPAPTKMLNLMNWAIDEKNHDPQVQALLKALTIDRSALYPRFSGKGTDREYECLSKSDKGALDEIVKRFGSKTFAELKALTHEMVAYEKAWSKRKRGWGGKKKGLQGSVPMAFEDFFEEDSDAVSGAREEMMEDFKLRRAFSAK
jgi:uncharacterized phage-associated protein